MYINKPKKQILESHICYKLNMLLKEILRVYADKINVKSLESSNLITSLATTALIKYKSNVKVRTN